MDRQGASSTVGGPEGPTHVGIGQPKMPGRRALCWVPGMRHPSTQPGPDTEIAHPEARS